MLGLSGWGALLSLLLEGLHRQAYLAPGQDSFCSLGSRLDCGSVALSSFAVLLGVPVALWGFAGFLAIGLAAWQASRWLLPLAALAALAGVVFTALSAFMVGAFCLPCEVAHATSLAIALIAWRVRAELRDDWRDAEHGARVLLPPLGLLLGFGFFLPPYWGTLDWREELPFAQGHTAEGAPWIGAEQPRLTLEEFVDYSCPHCTAASARTLTEVAAHRDSLRVVRRIFPRTRCAPRTDLRCLTARLALCADEQGRFWQADRWLFEHAAGGAVPSVEAAAKDLGLERARLEECVARDATFERADAAWRRAKKLRIPGTPYYADGDHILTAAAATALIDAL